MHGWQANLSEDYFVSRQDRYVQFTDRKLANFLEALVGSVSARAFKLEPSRGIGSGTGDNSDNGSSNGSGIGGVGSEGGTSGTSGTSGDGSGGCSGRRGGGGGRWDGVGGKNPSFSEPEHYGDATRFYADARTAMLALLAGASDPAANVNEGVGGKGGGSDRVGLSSDVSNGDRDAAGLAGAGSVGGHGPGGDDGDAHTGSAWVYPLFQMGPWGVRHDEAATVALLASLEAGTAVSLATGYFNLSKPYADAILATHAVRCAELLVLVRVRVQWAVGGWSMCCACGCSRWVGLCCFY
jgi:hypothetical protein